MKIRISYLGILVMIIAVMAVSGCGSKKATGTAGEKTVTVTTEAVSVTTMKNTITLNGTVKSLQEAEISSKVSGKVSEIHFELGQRVKQGDILFKLDDTDLRLELQQAEATLNVTRTSLDSSWVTAETDYQDAKRSYERSKRLYENHLVSKQDFEDAESSFKKAEDTYNAAKLAEGSGVTNAKATLEKALAEYEIAKTDLANTVVKAPIAGVVASKDLKIGQYVTTSDTVAELVDLSSMIVKANVTEAVVNQIKVGDQVEISVKSTLEHPVTGEIIAIAPAVDSSTLNYPIKIKVANPQNTLKSGMFAEVTLTLNRAERVLAVPLSAISEESGRKYVYLLDEGKAKRTLIQTGISDSQWIQVTEGLTEKDVVIVKGRDQLKDGSSVMIGE